jgi:hypothetical protein
VHNKNTLLDGIAKHETIYLIIMETLRKLTSTTSKNTIANG